jgi:hypothetical protein
MCDYWRDYSYIQYQWWMMIQSNQQPTLPGTGTGSYHAQKKQVHALVGCKVRCKISVFIRPRAAGTGALLRQSHTGTGTVRWTNRRNGISQFAFCFEVVGSHTLNFQTDAMESWPDAPRDLPDVQVPGTGRGGFVSHQLPSPADHCSGTHTHTHNHTQRQSLRHSAQV